MRLSKLAEDLMANPFFAQTMASALQKGMETKGALDRNLQTLLGLLNMPSKSDVRKLLTKLEILQATLREVDEKLDRVLATKRRSTRRTSRRGEST